jgi:hypothetical protein
MMSPTIVEFVPIDAGDDRVFDAELSDRLANVTRLIGVEWAGPAFTDCTEPAMPRADVAQDHEGRGPFTPAFEYVWATSLLADGV